MPYSRVSFGMTSSDDEASRGVSATAELLVQCLTVLSLFAEQTDLHIIACCSVHRVSYLFSLSRHRLIISFTCFQCDF